MVQYSHFSFYKADPQWRRLPPAEREAGKREFHSAVEEYAPRVQTLPYSTVGIRADTDLVLWRLAESPEILQEMSAKLLNTGLGRWLHTPHAYLSMARPSPYVAQHQHKGQEGTKDRVEPLGNRKYLFLYPFVKTPEWYFLKPEERQRMMRQHIEVGHKYPTVKNNTTYSFGLDDQEFIVAFESDKPEDFLALVEEMRSIETRKYTMRDTPIFTCIRRPLKECLDAMG